ncbi:MAG: hypothetical protein QOJ72_1667 [Nocardioidaceae bacterium]|jgi:DNA-binding CsgD family transcriptional regulator|nr:hypothetical protein [Nocardioidaceae bacterium]
MEHGSSVEGFAAVSELWRGSHESSLLVIGEPGIGKSHLLEELVSASTSPVELVRVNPAEQGYPLAGLALFNSWLSDTLRVSIAEALRDRDDKSAGNYTAAKMVLQHIRELCLPPTYLLIDDIDLMDADSQAMLGIIAGRLNGTGVRIVASATGVNGHESFSGMPRFELAPLSADELVDIGAARMPDADASTLRIVAAYAGGNPRILLEHLARLEPAQRDGSAPLTLPLRTTVSVDLLARTTMSRLSPVERAVVEMVALAPISRPDVLGDDSGVPDAIEDLVAASILTRVGDYVAVTDPRLRTSVYWEIGPRDRRMRHAQIAEATDPADVYLATWHRSWANDLHEDVDGLFAGALWLVEEGLAAEAVEFTERALSRTEDIDAHAALLLRLCIELLRAGDLVLVARYATRTDSTNTVAPAEAMALAAVDLAAHVFDGTPMIDADAWTLVRLHGDKNPDAAAAMLVVAAFRRAERWQTVEARSFVEGAARLEIGSGQTIEAVRVMGLILDALDGVPVEEDEVPRTRGPVFEPSVVLLRSRLLTSRERYAEARTEISGALNDPRGLEGSSTQLATLAQVINEVAAGEFRLARVALATLRSTSPVGGRGTSTHAYFEAWAAYSRGNPDEAELHLRSCFSLAEAEADQAMRARGLALRGAMSLMLRDLEGAVVDLRQVSVIAARFVNPTLLRHSADYVEACMLTNRPDEAQGGLARLEDRLAGRESRWGQLAVMRGRALVAPDDETVARFDACVDAFRPDESPYELGRTLLAFADRQTALGMVEASRRNQIAAVTAFERSGATAWSKRATQGVAPRDSRSRLLDQFDEEQREVIRLVVLGRRTREIAGALHISVRTVELRLTSIYRATGVASRKQLIALLSR